ncbi:MAG: alpha/beta hydrolase-fold protein [Neisseria sp.]|nr:alpha/beta hydrolase-fold protein [Neisseria sp.]
MLYLPPCCLQAAQWHDAVLPQAQETYIVSTNTGSAYRIQIARFGMQPPEGYPVLYILDGDACFPTAILMAHQAMNLPDGQNHTPVLPVGIGYPSGKFFDLPRRAADYTPPFAASAQQQVVTGGAEAFARFIDEELKQVVGRSVAVNPEQEALFGHSFGGLFGIYSLLTRPERFRHYFISSPSIWWQNRRVLDFAGTFRMPDPVLHISLSGAGRCRPENPAKGNGGQPRTICGLCGNAPDSCYAEHL